MGSFRIFFTECFSQSGNWVGATTNAQLLAAANNGSSSVYDWPLLPGDSVTCIAEFRAFGPCLQLDGAGPLLDVNHVPSGFNVTSCTVAAQLSPFITGSLHSYVSIGGNYGADGNGAGAGLSYNLSSGHVPSILDMMLNSYGVKLLVISADGNSRIAFNNLQVTGFYNILSSSYSWDVPNSSTPIHVLANTLNNRGSLVASNGIVKHRVGTPKANPATLNNYGDIVTVIAPSTTNPVTPLNLLDITAWYIEVPIVTPASPLPPIPFVFETSPNVNFIPITPDLILEWTPLIFKFLLPITIYPIILDYWINNPNIPLVPLPIIVVGDGTQFSGSVLLGTLTIIISDASGIYTISEDETNDTLYFRGGYTTDVRLSMLFPWSFDEVDEYDFYSMLPFPYKILSQSYTGEESDEEDLFITAALRTVVITENVEIPSPFIQTAFVP